MCASFAPRPKISAVPLALALMQKTDKEQTNLKQLSDDVIMNHLFTKHGEDETININLNDYISFIENVIKSSDQISAASHWAQGSKVHVELSDDSFTYSSSIEPPVCTLHDISKQMGCKAAGIDIAHKTTLDILSKLTKYSWEAKAVLIFTAFAMNYGALWHLDNYSRSDPLAKSLAMIKRVGSLRKELDSVQYGQVFFGPNSLIYSCLKAIKYMNEFKNLSKYDIKEVPELSAALRGIPLVSYWIVHALVASSIDLHCYLSGTEGQTHKYLSELTEKKRSILVTLEKHRQFIQKQQEEVELYRWLVDQTDHFPTDITLFLSKLIHGKHKARPLINCSTRLEEYIEDFLKEKNLILIVSKRLDVSKEDLDSLNVVYSEVKKGNKHEIVWVSVISDPPAEGDEEAYEALISKMKWYAVPFATKVAGLRFLEEKWEVREDLLVVVLNTQSKIEFPNAVHLTRIWEKEAIPFTYERANTLLKRSWIDSTVVKFTDQPRLNSLAMINKERTMIFYGGHTQGWIKRFEDTAEAIKRDPMLREEGITFELVPLGLNQKGEPDPTIMSRFWTAQRSFFILKHQLQGSTETEDISRLISYENEKGWAIITKGQTVVMVGGGDLIIKALEEFQTWKKNLRRVGFSGSFKDYFDELTSKSLECTHVNIVGYSGWIPLTVMCPVCRQYMGSGIRFTCCHGRPNVL
ncbi:protein SIEVE ELEMENT OCCLUSION B-like [Cucurbita maxima]|uniref:Protein SIEVE ELEMENT OCCLUSION B-like n=1 Tax=Cucurbita maxima TaxID=3661 RepID=A0A6J1KIF3_CUCMA|nr:protein SIEVE ELEMENT OCCLUSION B-like [Cucurbita maxima]